MSLSFPEWHARWPDWPGHGRQVAFEALPQRDRDACWDDLAEQCRRWTDAEYLLEQRRYEEWPAPKRHQPQQQSSTAARSRNPAAVALSSDDPLKKIEPRLYVEALTGEVVPANGRLCCPLPDHEDSTPSFQVLQSHWRCFGCGRGGSIIDFGAAWYGITPRGSGYHEIRRRLADDLGLRRTV